MMPDANPDQSLLDYVADVAAEAQNWRRHLHQQPELQFDLPRTSAFVLERLREFGCDEIHTGIATSGVVAIVKGARGPGRTIALRCDMDALPITEASGKAYSSQISGRMHACGHDGHTAMMLGVGKLLSAHRDFAGSVALVFQPAEEGGGGARVMLEEGLLERFGIEEVYALHNLPGLPIGAFAIRPGPLFASSDRFRISITGKGGHAALPHLANDPVVVAANLVGQLQNVASRHVDPIDSIVLSITYIEAGSPAALNVIPEKVSIGGTLRALQAPTRQSALTRIRKIVEAVCAAADVQAEFQLHEGYPLTVNDTRATDVAIQAARAVAGEGSVDPDCPPTMGAEDFSYMLQRRPGAIIWLGNGDSASLHNPTYDFDDRAIPYGIAYWLSLVRELCSRHQGVAS